ncbi:MAG TPA: NYN domain-containing protein [Pirellulaceae bacterium]|nr:NYN domain-containing protein [Pirellulaceae bacterium]
MTILIDGYNLLHVTGLAGPEISRSEIKSGALERARMALLNFLATSLDDDERQLTTVAFDSSNAPPGLPREEQHRGITVKYATDHESADELLEELIRVSSAPRRLTVVSSDHRVQRAARRRKARAVDSDVWYAEMRAKRREKTAPATTASPKPAGPLSAEEVAAWLNEFGDVAVEELAASELGPPATGATVKQPASSPIENPFPPGYADDLLGEK